MDNDDVTADIAGPPLHKFMMSFTDGRDSGLLLVSHFSLLTGCAVSVWLALSLQPPGKILAAWGAAARSCILRLRARAYSDNSDRFRWDGYVLSFAFSGLGARFHS